jgi:HD-like signal output (HDOD) protein
MLDPVALVKAAHALDPLPATVSGLAALVVREDWSLAEATHLVEFDPALTGRLLRLANSAATAGLSPVTTAREAIQRVGIGPALAFAAASGLGRYLRRALPEYGLAEGHLWRHAVASALAADRIAKRSEVHLPPEVFAAALLHDIGKIVLARFLDAEHLSRLAAAREQGAVSSLEAEIATLGVTHAELGGLIAAHWRLPERIVSGLIHHHAPDDCGEPVCDGVYLANVAAKRLGEGMILRDDELVPASASLARLGLSFEAFESICRELREAFERTLTSYSWN